MNWKILYEQEILSIKPWFNVTKQYLKLPSGLEISDYYQINQPSYCEIAVRDDKGRFLIQDSYKHGVRGATLGFPGGYINADEIPSDAAARELHEECGLHAACWQGLGSYVIDGNRGTAKVHLFFADQITNAGKIPSDDVEEINSFWADCKQIKHDVEVDRFKTLGARLLAEEVLKIEQTK